MPFFVGLRCPECGAPLKLPEGALTFKCPFCASVLRVQNGGASLKYVLPPKVTAEELPVLVKRAVLAKNLTGLKKIRKIITLQKPFWYCKGTVYFSSPAGGDRIKTSFSTSGTVYFTSTVRVGGMAASLSTGGNEPSRTEVEAKMWYHSFPANPICPPFLSLGIQTEVLTLEQFDSEAFPGTVILPVEVTPEQARVTAEKAAREAFNLSDGLLDHSPFTLIGDGLFIIYYPVMAAVCDGTDGLHTLFFDGVNGRLLHDEPGKEIPATATPVAAPPSSVTSHRCANCGHDLEPKDFDVVYYCSSCFRIWLLKNDGYREIERAVLGTGEEQYPLYLPFWKFTVRLQGVSGAEIRTIGDWMHLMKEGEGAADGEDSGKPVTFYVPALLTRNPNAVFKLAVRISRVQRSFPQSSPSRLPGRQFCGATMPPEEARKMLSMIVFSIIGRTDGEAVNFYQKMEGAAGEPELVWYPFQENRDMLVDAFSPFNNIAKRVITDSLY